jgi:protein translocase SecG subunit
MIVLLAATGWSITLSIFFAIICILLVFMVVITPSQEGGMAAAFGGLGSDSFFGTKAHQHINKFTVFLAISFLVLAVVINKVNSSSTVKSGAGLEEKMKGLPPKPEKPEMPPGHPK